LPARHALARALLASGRAREARGVYREDLARHPENAEALMGLAATERWLGHADVADALERRARMAWPRADVALPEPASTRQRRR
jgi:hypothetical protein